MKFKNSLANTQKKTILDFYEERINDYDWNPYWAFIFVFVVTSMSVAIMAGLATLACWAFGITLVKIDAFLIGFIYVAGTDIIKAFNKIS